MLNKLRIIWTAIQMGITVSITIILMYLFKSKNRAIRKVWGAIQIKLLDINLEIEGTLDEDADMIMMNHQSLVDIILFEYLHPKDLAWVAKKEIASLPWFGHILKAPDMIIIERENKSSLVKLLKESKIRYEQNRPIAIFPEGTRTDGKSLRKFKAGAKLVAQKYNFKVQPIVIVGTRDILDTHNLTQNSGSVKIIYLPTIQVDKDSLWYENMHNDMASILTKAVQNGNNAS
jgi:1-acyl-sn-glycerol-3-phosphate acyltransferase